MKKININKFGIIFVILLFVIFSFILNETLIDLDELWNYSFSKNISDGLVPYKDFNLVTTPFLYFVVSVFLKFVFNGLLMTRFLASVLAVLILIMVFLVLNKLIKNKYVNLFIVLNLCLILIPFFCLDYNFLVLLLALIILNYELKSKDEELLKLNIKNDFLIGIVAGLAILTKQSTGFFIAFTYVMYKWLAIRKKGDIVLAFKISLSRGIGVLVPVAIFFAYLIATNSFMDFWNFCLFGVSEFKNSIPYSELLNSELYEINVKILAAMALIVIGYSIIYLIANFKLKTLESKNFLKLFVYGIASFIVIYPISNDIHFLIGVIILIILTIYIISTHCNLKNESLKKNLGKLTIYLCYIMITVLVVVMFKNYFQYIRNDEKFHNLNHYNGIPVNENFVYVVNMVNKYIEEEEKNGKNVYIINADAVLYNSTKDRYNKYFDLPLKGNLGKNGVEIVINKIDELDNNSIILVLSKGKSLNWQIPREIIEYVRNNCELIGNIGSYDIYTKNY